MKRRDDTIPDLPRARDGRATSDTDPDGRAPDAVVDMVLDELTGRPPVYYEEERESAGRDGARYYAEARHAPRAAHVDTLPDVKIVVERTPAPAAPVHAPPGSAPNATPVMPLTSPVASGPAAPSSGATRAAEAHGRSLTEVLADVDRAELADARRRDVPTAFVTAAPRRRGRWVVALACAALAVCATVAVVVGIRLRTLDPAGGAPSATAAPPPSGAPAPPPTSAAPPPSAAPSAPESVATASAHAPAPPKTSPPSTAIPTGRGSASHAAATVATAPTAPATTAAPPPSTTASSKYGNLMEEKH